MDNRVLVSIRVTMAVMILLSTVNTVTSWAYMDSALWAGAYTVISLFAVIMWVRLWLSLEKLFREMAALQKQMEEAARRILDGLGE